MNIKHKKINSHNQNDDANFIKVEKKNKLKINNLPNIFDEKFSKKKILCNTFFKGDECQYGDKCLYAHSITQQKMDVIRKRAYDIIQNEFDLSYLDLGNKNDNESADLLLTLILLTKICYDCINKKCAGGVNCKFGVYNKSLQICYEDMMNGKCNSIHNDNVCNKIHLTKRGFIPINKNKERERERESKKNKKKIYGLYIPKSIELNDDFFKSDKYKNLIEESESSIDKLSSDSHSLSESIFD
jgi:hypothetical protein